MTTIKTTVVSQLETSSLAQKLQAHIYVLKNLAAQTQCAMEEVGYILNSSQHCCTEWVWEEMILLCKVSKFEIYMVKLMIETLFI